MPYAISEVEIGSDEIKKTWRNNADNWVIEVSKDEVTHLVEIESREVVNRVEENELQEKIEALIGSPDFQSTHSAVAELVDLVSYLSTEDIQKLNQAVEENNQVGGIIDDDDLEKFFKFVNV